ncbi:MAG TPA: rhodanese-like domain-containing protein [Gemmatimonadales bacterium]|jgi:thiosulfate/3-mercaptopyruvate sulfurtransferase
MRSRLLATAIAAGITLSPSLAAAQFATNPASAVVTVPWLTQHLHDRDLVVLHVGPPDGYTRGGHIPGARYVAYHDLSTPMTAGPLMLEMPPQATLDSAIASFGISNQSRIVVVFDSEWVSPATRVLFTLGYAGLADRSSLLDGGLAAWRKAGNPVTTDVPNVTPGVVSHPVRSDLIVDHDYVAAHAHTGHATLIDARATSFYTGPSDGTRSAGHVPGAVNLPYDEMTDSNDFLLAKSAIEAKFEHAGVAAGDTVVAYCHVGQQATLLLFGAWITGHPVRLYDGSFQDWSLRKLPTEGGR